MEVGEKGLREKSVGDGPRIREPTANRSNRPEKKVEKPDIHITKQKLNLPANTAMSS